MSKSNTSLQIQEVALPNLPAGEAAGRIIELDVLRSFAVLLVLGRHAPPLNSADTPLNWFMEVWRQGGWIGVDLFFVLSGFLVSSLLFIEHRQRGTIDVLRFYFRRGLRIYPLFYVFLLATLLLPLVERHRSWKNFAVEIFFMQNYLPPVWNHTWSLAVEEHFYLILPAILYALLRFRPGMKAFTAMPVIFLATAVSMLALRIFKQHLSGNLPIDHRAYIASHLRLDALFFGVCLSYYWHYFREQLKSLPLSANAAIVLGLLLMAPPFLFPVETTPWIPTLGLTMNYIGAGLLLYGALCRSQKGSHSGFVIWIANLGRDSYSTYLWHMMVLEYVLLPGTILFGRHTQLAQIIAFLTGSFLVGRLSAIVIEKPILKMRNRYFPSRAEVGFR